MRLNTNEKGIGKRIIMCDCEQIPTSMGTGLFHHGCRWIWTATQRACSADSNSYTADCEDTDSGDEPEK